MVEPDLGALGTMIEWMRPTGSRAICTPPPTDTDEDWLCKVADIEEFLLAAEADGFETSSYWLDEDDDGDSAISNRFVSFRRGNLNLIVTASQEFAKRFMAATSVAASLNLLNKSDRIDLFRAVLYGEEVECCESPKELTELTQ